MDCFFCLSDVEKLLHIVDADQGNGEELAHVGNGFGCYDALR